MCLFHVFQCGLVGAYVAEFWVFDEVDAVFFACWVVLRRVQRVKIEERGFHAGASHLFEAQSNQFLADFFEEAEVGVFFSRPSFCHWCFDVVFLEFAVSPFACDYEFWRELGDFCRGFALFCGLFACCCDFYDSVGFDFCGEQFPFFQGLHGCLQFWA